jgi:hypothetical protein
MFTECSVNAHRMFTECSLNVHWMLPECAGLITHQIETRMSISNPLTHCTTLASTCESASTQWEKSSPSLEEGSGSPSNCEPPPGPKHAEASVTLLYFWFYLSSLNVHWMFTKCSLNVHWMFTECSLYSIFGSTSPYSDVCGDRSYVATGGDARSQPSHWLHL